MSPTRRLTQRPSRSPSRPRGDGGFVAAEWAIGIAVLVVPMMMLLAVLPTWSARHEAASAAAREATRTAVAHVDGPSAAAAARTTAVEVLDGRMDHATEAVITVEMPPTASGTAPREGIVRVRVALPGRPVTLPMFGTIDAPTVSATHERALNPYRGRP